MTGSRPLELRLLGRFVAIRDGREIPAAEFGGRKVRALLRILATRRGSIVPSDVLTELLWGDRPPADPATNLQVLVNRARRALGRAEVIVTGQGGYALTDGAGVTVDAEQFRAAVADARRSASIDAYLAALALWAGDPLAEDSYADWAIEYRTTLIRTYQQGLEEAAQLALEDGGDPAIAVDLAARAADAEPLREVAVLLLVRALAAAGDPAAALGRYEQFRRALADELGVDPSAEAQELQQQLLRGGRRAQPAGRAPVELRFDSLPFVGRDAEVAALIAAASGRGVAVLLGESGAGKSRLLEQLAAQVPVVLVRAFHAEQDEPWSLARSLFREALAADEAAAEQLPAPIGAALRWLLPEVELPVPDTPPEPETRRALLGEAALRLLAAGGAAIVIDDMQWADETSLALLDTVLARLDTVGVVLAARPGDAAERGPVAQLLDRVRASARLIELHPLSAEEIGELAGDPALATRLAAATDGTPIAVVEVLRALAGEGAIARTTQQRWRVLDRAALHRVDEVALAGQRAAIARRVAAQPVPAREVLRLLALVARESSARAVALAAEQDERVVLDVLSALSRAGLARLGERGWATAHDMVGEVVVEELDDTDRARLHGRLAHALDALDGEPGAAAEHWLGAGDTERATDAYLHAATRALDVFADGEALVLAEAGLSVAQATGTRADLRAARAEARARRGEIAGARDDLRAAIQAQPAGPARARLLARLATVASGAQDLVRAAEVAETALLEAGKDAAARAAALEIAAVLDMNLDRAERADERATEALRLYEQIGDARGRARVLDGRAMATFLAGRISEGTQLLRRAADLFEDSGDLLRVVTPRSTAGHALIFGGVPLAGLELTRSALELARTLGHPEGQTYALWHCAEALADTARTDEALAAAEEALAIAQGIGHRGWTATAYRALGIARQAAGEPDDALAAFQRSLDLSEHLNLFACWAAARAAVVLVSLGRLDEAAPLVERALVEGPPLGHFEARLAEVELAAARNDPATSDLARTALHQADDAGMRQSRERLVALAHPG